MTEAVTFDSTDGLRLEGEFDAPETPQAVLVLCHPHPKMGGTMNAPLLLAIRDEMVRRNWVVLRFNFRGIGASEGKASTGREEVADAEGALDVVQERWPDLPVALAGWSFGGAVALRTAAARPEVIACATIAPAIVPKPGITEGAPNAETFSADARVLLVCGANDELVRPADCRRWAETTGSRYEEMKGANHFFWAKYDGLAEVVGDFLDSSLS